MANRFDCGRCKRPFHTSEELQKHKKETLPKFACQRCGTILATRLNAEKHLITTHKLKEVRETDFMLLCIEQPRKPDGPESVSTPQKMDPTVRKNSKESPYSGKRKPEQPAQCDLAKRLREVEVQLSCSDSDSEEGDKEDKRVVSSAVSEGSSSTRLLFEVPGVIKVEFHPRK